MAGFHAGEDPAPPDDLVVVDPLEHPTFDGCSPKTDLPANRLCRSRVVAGDHHDPHAGSSGGRQRRASRLTWWIRDAGEAVEDEVALDLLALGCGRRLPSECEHPQRLARQLFVGVSNPTAVVVSQRASAL